MSSDGVDRWETIEALSPTLFLAAGPLVLIAVVLAGVRGLTEVAIPYIVFWPFLPLGFAVSLAGLVGLHRQLVDRAPRLAKAGAGFTLFGLLLLVVGIGGLVVTAPPGPYPENLGALGPAFFFGFIAVIPAFATYGIASLRTATPTGRMGALLLAVGLLQFLQMFGPVLVSPVLNVGHHGGLWFQLGVYGLVTAALVVVGSDLRTRALSSGPTDMSDAPA